VGPREFKRWRNQSTKLDWIPQRGQKNHHVGRGNHKRGCAQNLNETGEGGGVPAECEAQIEHQELEDQKRTVIVQGETAMGFRGEEGKAVLVRVLTKAWRFPELRGKRCRNSRCGKKLRGSGKSKSPGV